MIAWHVESTSKCQLTHFQNLQIVSMLKNNAIWAPDGGYKSNSDWEPLDFFVEGLSNAKEFDLLLGFFSSSAIEVLCDSFAYFLYQNGKMRLVVNNLLGESDRQAIVKGWAGHKGMTYDLNSLSQLRNTFSRRDTHFFDCLAFLIREGRLDIKVIAPSQEVGIAHYKCGIFRDSKHKVAFSGSCNFSKTALIDNLERLDTFCSWESDRELSRVMDLEQQFETIFSENDPTVCYLETSELCKQLLEEWPQKDIDMLLKEEEELLSERMADCKRPQVGKALQRARDKVQKAINEIAIQHWQELKQKGIPHFPYPTGPRAYQQEAYEKWESNGRKGLFAMATGTGKTLTSLNCLLKLYETQGCYKALILVPTLTLLTQWESECRKFGFETIIPVSSEQDNVQTLSNKKTLDKIDNKQNYVIISTYRSFSTRRFFDLFNDLSSNTLFIADECHNLGASTTLTLLNKVKMDMRIGLSATPERQFDDEANMQVSDFLGCISNEYTYSFTMREAIEQGFLCRYEYYPHLVMLDSEEMDEYIEISKKLARCYSSDGNIDNEANETTQKLLLKRKRIIHKARGKLPVFRKILQERIEQQGNLKYSLVYVPEGSNPDADTQIDSEDALIDEYTKVVRDMATRPTVQKFTATTENRDQLLKDFAVGKVEVLTSMKCLDEGVDVPRSEFAVFCASTGNPRQFIQRRGRILRTHPDKHRAIIHDLVVIPFIDASDKDCYNIERNLLRGELNRVRDFASLSETAFNARETLKEVLEHYKLSIYEDFE